MILFEWGTYNALSTLKQASLLGTRVTEIPPAILSRRLPEGYYESYKRLAKEYFSTILAHGPYYQLSSESGLRGHISAIEKASICGAEIYNYHLGKRVGDDINFHLEVLKKFNEVNNSLIYSPEPATNIGEFGSLDELLELVKAAKDEGIKVIPSLQLENIFLNELKVYETDDLEEASKKADIDWWLKILYKVDKISEYIMHFRFSQVIGLKYKNRFFKKRVPLGKGYPPLEPLVEALSTYLVDNALKGAFKKVLFVYTGLPEVKYKDLIDIYAMIMKRAVDKLMSKEAQLEYGEFYKILNIEEE
ncbi:hypothetical protein J422_00481 [Methanocaldococcus villosus KIN24-T80]|uniref:Xylose isomerase-like TIM barrel domain-containing protein n=1 Tax=Methanocaldococcus villosus KIN24-T80 TaxID=1069083 RepID=N6W061_9EURY|nr:hypothetical protein [Methanocaldococcus villosus]ENN96747.1 hypothetical protein J422_00481 [Methanocaldococcus villosus KIN24-T80]